MKPMRRRRRPDDPLLSEVDIAALERAIELAQAESAATRQQIDAMLRERAWEEVARFAAYCCQDRALALKPWQMPPCWVRCDPNEILQKPYSDERGHDYRGEQQAARLLKKLLAAGLSKFEPDPIGGLARKAAN
jgi:hypothetical protein